MLLPILQELLASFLVGEVMQVAAVDRLPHGHLSLGTSPPNPSRASVLRSSERQRLIRLEGSAHLIV